MHKEYVSDLQLPNFCENQWEGTFENPSIRLESVHSSTCARGFSERGIA